MNRLKWPVIARICLMIVGLIWLFGLFLPTKDHASFNLDSALTAEKIYTSLTDTAALAYLLTGDSSQIRSSDKKSEPEISFRLVKAFPYQSLSFESEPRTLSIEKLEGEIQLSPDENGIKVELRSRISIRNNPIDKLNYWMSPWRLKVFFNQIKFRLAQKL